MTEPIRPPHDFLVEEMVKFPTADRSKAELCPVPDQTFRMTAITRAQLDEARKRGRQ